MKILHLLTDVGGNAWGLSRGERQLGLESEVMTSVKSTVGYPTDICLDLDKLTGSKYLIQLKALRKKIATFFSIRNKYDVFHFNFGSSLISMAKWEFLDFIDLSFYPKNAKLFVTYNGCDARQKYPTMKRTCVSSCLEKNCQKGMCNSGQLDILRQRRIAKMSQYTKHMWALNPDLLYFLPQEKSSFLPYTVASPSKKLFVPDFERKLKIVHSPTNRDAKGTKYILAATEKLSQKYPDAIELILVENLSYTQALEVYEKADLVIDQILVGWYGAFAVEVMMMGKPVIARIAENDLHFIPKAMKKDLEEAVINADPMTIYNVLESLIQNREVLKKYSSAALEYAHKWHNPLYVSGLVKEKYDNY